MVQDAAVIKEIYDGTNVPRKDRDKRRCKDLLRGE